MITNEIVNRAISYIMEHINEEITIEQVANYCNFSKFYFSRVFKEETGESLYAFIKRMRIDQSAFRLKVERGRKITDIGLDYGYSPSNYSSVFKQYHDISPAVFRKNIVKRSIEHPFFKRGQVEMESLEECNKKISIEQVQDFQVIYERQIGNYYNLGAEWETFCEKYKDYTTEKTIFYERTFDDPSITDSDSCLYDLCISAPEGCKLENQYRIPGGKFAVYHFKGYPQQIYSRYQTMFNVWLPHYHYEIDERYGFDLYREIDCEKMYLIMDIYIPIK